MKLAFEPEPFDADDAKRFHVPGAVLTGECPKCGATYEHDFGESYLSYPRANEPEDFTCWCSACDHEWVIRLKLVISLALVVMDPLNPDICDDDLARNIQGDYDAEEKAKEPTR